MKRTVTIMADVEVVVDLRRFSTEDLMDELKEREEMRLHNKLKAIALANDREIEDASDSSQLVEIPKLNSGGSHPLHGVYYALKFGKKNHAVDLMRDYLADLFGVCL